MKQKCTWLLFFIYIITTQVHCTFNARIYDINSLSTSSTGKNESDNTQVPIGTLSYSISQPYYTTQQGISLVPSGSSGNKDFTITPNLPAGVSIDFNTGIISGTPTASSGVQSYVVSAKDAAGNLISTTITFETAKYFLVNTLNDTSDINPGDGVCLDAGGKCSVRAALEEAHALGDAKLSYIDIPSGNYGVDSAPLLVKSRAILKGAGSLNSIFDGSKDGTAVGNVVTISGDDVTIDGLAVKNGSYSGAGLVAGVGISSTAKNLTMKNCEVSNNNITSSGIISTGVGMYHYSTGDLLIQKCVFQNNTQMNSPTFASGGGIYGSATNITIENSIISNNGFITSAGSSYGGGLYIGAVSKSVFKNTIITANQARNRGAGLFIYNSADFTDVTFMDNVGAGFIFGNELYVNSAGTFNFERSLIKLSAAMQAIRATDGAVLNFKNSTLQTSYVLAQISNAQLNFDSCTLSSTTNLFIFPGSNLTGEVSFKNSIVGAITLDAASTNPHYQSYGYNIFLGTPSFTILSSDLLNTDALLNALSSNGGATQTRSTQVGSPARNFIPQTYCQAEDQRAQLRSANGATCDAGAYQH